MAFSIDVEPANYINLDLFPATVESSIFKPLHEEYRVIVTDNYLYIIDDAYEGPTAVVREPLISFDGDNKVGYTVETALGTVFIRRALNCGCGSRLRGLHPFPGVPHIARLNR